MRRPARAPDDGAAAVEFAFISVLLLTILFGILQYGYFFFQSTAAEHAAREGARLASVGIAPPAFPTPSCAAWAQEVADRAGSADVTGVEAEFLDSDGVLGLDRGDTVKVTVTWAPSDFQFPFIPFIGGSAYPEVASTRVERIGGSVPTNCDEVIP